MNWDEFLQAERAKKTAFIERLLCGNMPFAANHPDISQQLITEHRQYIADIDAMAERS